MRLQSRFRTLVLFLALVPLSGCLFRHRTPERTFSTATLRDASLEQLVQTVNSNAAAMQSFRADVEIDTSVGGEKKGSITDYKQIAGYVLVRKPEMLRMIGLVPVVRNRLFDMVSNGTSFELSIPPKNKFIVGSNQITRISPQPIENLRPQHILDALLLKSIRPEDTAVLEQSTEVVKDPKTHKDVDQPNYVLLVLEHDEKGPYLSRKIIFSRVDLLPHEQLIYNRPGQLVTHARYENFTDYNGTMFPGIVQIERPIEEYTITLTIEKLYQEALKDEQFVLTQPVGSQVVNIDKSTTAEVQPTASSPALPQSPKQ